VTFLTQKINPKTIMRQKDAKRRSSVLYPLLLWVLTDFMCHFVENQDRNYVKQMQSSMFSTFESVNSSDVLSDVLFFSLLFRDA